MTKSSIPKGWRLAKFGDVVDNLNETTRDPESIGLDRVVGLDHMDPESLPLKRWDNLSDLHEGTSFTRVFRAGQVLFGKRRAYQRKVSLPDFNGICSGDILVFQPKNAELLPEFLPYLVQSNGFFDHALGTSAGSLSPRTKWQELAKYEFALPPIAEQHRIIKLIKNIDQLIEAHREIPFGQQREAMLLDLLRVNSQGSKSVCLNEISTISYGYTESAFREIVGPKFLRITDIQDGAVDWESVPYCRIDDATFAKQKLNDGDIVFARTGTVGKSFLVRNPPDAVSASYLIRVQADTIKVIPEFLFLNFQTRDYWKQIHAGKSGSVQGGFNASKLGKLEIPLPPLAKQLEIVGAMAALHNLEVKTILSLKQLSKLRISLLNRQLYPGVPNV
jgi:type I restriction enzyme S subunit